MTRRGVLLGAALYIASAAACHRPFARRRRPEPTPVVSTPTPVTPPVLSDALWIDSVRKSWTAPAGQRSPASAAGRASARPAPPSDTGATSQGTMTATSYAEAGLPQEASMAIAGVSDDHGPILILIAIGLIALGVSMEAGRFAFRRQSS